MVYYIDRQFDYFVNVSLHTTVFFDDSKDHFAGFEDISGRRMTKSIKNEV